MHRRAGPTTHEDKPEWETDLLPSLCKGCANQGLNGKGPKLRRSLAACSRAPETQGENPARQPAESAWDPDPLKIPGTGCNDYPY